MNAISLDLTIESVLADPVIAAAMRADSVDPRFLEDLLTSTARRLELDRGVRVMPWAALAGQACAAAAGSCARW